MWGCELNAYTTKERNLYLCIFPINNITTIVWNFLLMSPLIQYFLKKSWSKEKDVVIDELTHIMIAQVS